MLGIFDPRDNWSTEEARRTLIRALRGRRATIERHRAFHMAVPGEDPAGSGDPLVVLEGSIYNLRGLAAQCGLDPSAAAHSILLSGFARWGRELPGRLRGEFALLLWNGSEGLLARDHVGVGPGACFSPARGGLLFGSEVRDVTGLLPRRPAPDDEMLVHWLVSSPPVTGRTLYQHVERLPSGHLVSLDRQGWTLERYWAPRYSPQPPRDRNSLAAELGQLLSVATSRRDAVGSAGLMLSGGLDSAAVAAITARQRGARAPRLRTYSAAFPSHPRVDEGEIIALLAETLGLDACTTAVGGASVLEGSLEYLRTWELPPSSPNLFFWIPILRRACGDGIAVLLDGEGGDEVFGFAAPLVADRLRAGRPLAALELVHRFPGAGDHPPLRPVITSLRHHGVRSALPWRVNHGLRRVGRPGHGAPPWLLPRSAAAYRESEDPWEWTRAPGPRWWSALQNAVFGRHAAAAHDHIDRRARMCGLEARHPLLDVDIVEFILGIDPELAFDPHLSRPLLRESVRGLLPDRVRLRASKSYFDAVFHEALDTVDRPHLNSLLSSRDAELRRYVDLGQVQRLLHSAGASPDGPRRRAIYLWRLAIAECWLLAQSDPDAPARLLRATHPGERRAAGIQAATAAAARRASA